MRVFCTKRTSPAIESTPQKIVERDRAHRARTPIGDDAACFIRLWRRTMWQVHATFRIGALELREIDLTPAIGVLMIVVMFLLMLQSA
jgi:hypothetical protein